MAKCNSPRKVSFMTFYLHYFCGFHFCVQVRHPILIWAVMFDSNVDICIWFLHGAATFGILQTGTSDSYIDSNIWFLNGQQRLDSTWTATADSYGQSDIWILTWTATADSYGQWHLDSYMDSFLRILKWTATSGSEMDSNVADSHIDNV